jgi:hypothetical protein
MEQTLLLLPRVVQQVLLMLLECSAVRRCVRSQLLAQVLLEHLLQGLGLLGQACLGAPG